MDKQVYTIRFHLYEVQKQAKLICGDRNQKDSCLIGGGAGEGWVEMDWEGEEGNFLYLDCNRGYMDVHKFIKTP